MVNKVLGAYVVADLLFVITGAILVGFCVVVQNQMFEVPTEGGQAVENLLYQMFPLTGMQPKSRIRWAEGNQAGQGFCRGPCPGWKGYDHRVCVCIRW